MNFEKLIFSNFCKLCESIARSKGKKIKEKRLKEYVNSFRSKQPDIDFYLLLRFLLPSLDRTRGPYGIKEHNLAKIYIRILDLPNEGKDAAMLLNFRSPTNNASTDITADFAEVAYWILKHRCGDTTNIELGEVSNYLDKLAQQHAEHNPRGVDEILIEMLRKMSALEQKWLMRIILKHMHLGLGISSILETYHIDAMKVYDISSNLLKVTTLLKDENKRLHELEISMFEHVRPMLSEKCDINKINFTGEYFIDEKLDGERFHIHFHDGKFKYFSRNAYDYSNNYGESKDQGYFTSQICRQLKDNVTSFILDGEMMGWHTKKNCLLTKASNIDVKTLRVGGIIQPCFSAFDIIYYNDTVLTNKPLEERLEILYKIFKPQEGVIMHTPRIKVSNNDDILKALNNAIDNQLEGIIVKDPKSLYKANSRNSGWFKIKPEYSDGALIELDLLIMGGYFGEGKRRGQIAQFLLGLAVCNDNGVVKEISSFCRVGSGYTVAELNELITKLNPYWQKFRPNQIPSMLLITKEKPDVWVEPNKSFILQVKATEVIKSDLYHFGYTLRFPRVEKIRYDKLWDDCLTTMAFAEIVKTYSAKLTLGHLGRKRGKLTDQIIPDKVPKIEKIGDLFLGKEICILTGDTKITKDELEATIIQQGGTLVNNPGVNTYCIIAGAINIRVKNFISAEKHVVASLEWVQNCIAQSKLLPFEKTLVHSAPQRKQIAIAKHSSKLKEENDVALTNLHLTFEQMNIPKDGFPIIANKNLLYFEEKLFGTRNPYSIFRNIHVYFDKEQTDESTTEEILFKFYSGIIDKHIADTTNFVIVNRSCDNISNRRYHYNDHSHRNFKFLVDSWISVCCQENKLLDYQKFMLE